MFRVNSEPFAATPGSAMKNRLPLPMLIATACTSEYAWLPLDKAEPQEVAVFHSQVADHTANGRPTHSVIAVHVYLSQN